MGGKYDSSEAGTEEIEQERERGKAGDNRKCVSGEYHCGKALEEKTEQVRAAGTAGKCTSKREDPEEYTQPE